MSQAPALPDWGGPRTAEPAGAARAWRGFVLVEGVLVLIALACLFTGRAAFLVVAAGLAVVAAGMAVRMLAQGRRALSQAEARPARPGDAPRLENLVRGLSADIGAPAPALWVVPEGGPNALVARVRGSAVIAVTRGATETLTLTELEAIVAHCLVRLQSSDLRATSIAVALGAPRLATTVGSADDVAAAALTRYPPALASAVAKAEARSGRFAPFWFVALDPSHVPVEERVSALTDL